MSGVTQEEADRVLRLKSRERESHACYVCRRRKVKCDGGQPCRTCQKRKHPEICTYDQGTPSRQRTAARSRQSTTISDSVSSPRLARQTAVDQEPNPGQQEQAAKNYVYSGDNSVVSILRSCAPDANDPMAREVGSVLGLQNTFNSYPFMDSQTPEQKWKSLLGALPQRTEILKFFHYYRVTAYPYNPIVADLDRFEASLCTYLNGHAQGEFRDSEKMTERWASDKSIGLISLILATLASGAHYSDVEYPRRLDLTMDFARRSFLLLRLANFLFRPSLDIIQTLLILGNTLQNMGQSDAAWALLGTTVRLAQTMGLHTERSTVHWPEYVRTKARTLWSMVVWQDSLLCLCYDRPPIVSVAGWPLDQAFFERQNLSYAEIMHLLCRLGLDIMRPEAFGLSEVDRAIDGLHKLDSACQRSRGYLQNRDTCVTLQQNLEHLALKMHTSFCVSVLCRPAMRQSQPQPPYSRVDLLRTRAKESLIDASKAFLDFQALSTVPLRSWSMIHTVLSSTLLLCTWEETRHDDECRSLQQQVIDVFSSSDARSEEDAAALPDSNEQWLSARHIRALVMLRSALDREHGAPPNQSDMFRAIGLENVLPHGGAK